VNDSDLVFGEVVAGANSSSRETSSPTIQSACSQRGVGWFAAGFGGSLGGPGRAELER
jgi:hypothetical protein